MVQFQAVILDEAKLKLMKEDALLVGYIVEEPQTYLIVHCTLHMRCYGMIGMS